MSQITETIYSDDNNDWVDLSHKFIECFCETVANYFDSETVNLFALQGDLQADQIFQVLVKDGVVKKEQCFNQEYQTDMLDIDWLQRKSTRPFTHFFNFTEILDQSQGKILINKLQSIPSFTMLAWFQDYDFTINKCGLTGMLQVATLKFDKYAPCCIYFKHQPICVYPEDEFVNRKSAHQIYSDYLAESNAPIAQDITVDQLWQYMTLLRKQNPPGIDIVQSTIIENFDSPIIIKPWTGNGDPFLTVLNTPQKMIYVFSHSKTKKDVNLQRVYSKIKIEKQSCVTSQMTSWQKKPLVGICSQVKRIVLSLSSNNNIYTLNFADKALTTFHQTLLYELQTRSIVNDSWNQKQQIVLDEEPTPAMFYQKLFKVPFVVEQAGNVLSEQTFDNLTSSSTFTEDHKLTKTEGATIVQSKTTIRENIKNPKSGIFSAKYYNNKQDTKLRNPSFFGFDWDQVSPFDLILYGRSEKLDDVTSNKVIAFYKSIPSGTWIYSIQGVFQVTLVNPLAVTKQVLKKYTSGKQIESPFVESNWNNVQNIKMNSIGSLLYIPPLWYYQIVTKQNIKIVQGHCFDWPCIPFLKNDYANYITEAHLCALLSTTKHLSNLQTWQKQGLKEIKDKLPMFQQDLKWRNLIFSFYQVFQKEYVETLFIPKEQYASRCARFVVQKQMVASTDESFDDIIQDFDTNEHDLDRNEQIVTRHQSYRMKKPGQVPIKKRDLKQIQKTKDLFKTKHQQEQQNVENALINIVSNDVQNMLQLISPKHIYKCYSIQDDQKQRWFIKMIDTNQNKVSSQDLERHYNLQVQLQQDLRFQMASFGQYYANLSGYFMPFLKSIRSQIDDGTQNIDINLPYQMVYTLACIHSKNFVHNNIKPQNVFINQNTCVFSDFTHYIDLTSEYTAPELKRNEAPVDQFKSDSWSLGMVISQYLKRFADQDMFKNILKDMGHDVKDKRLTPCQILMKYYLSKYSAQIYEQMCQAFKVDDWVVEDFKMLKGLQIILSIKELIDIYQAFAKSNKSSLQFYFDVILQRYIFTRKDKFGGFDGLLNKIFNANQAEKQWSVGSVYAQCTMCKKFYCFSRRNGQLYVFFNEEHNCYMDENE